MFLTLHIFNINISLLFQPLCSLLKFTKKKWISNIDGKLNRWTNKRSINNLHKKMTYQSSTSGSISVASREMVANIHRYVRWIFPLSSLDGGGSLYGVRGVKLIGSKKLIGGTSSVQESWAISLWCLIRSSIHSKISILNFYFTFNRLYAYIYTTQFAS